MHCYKYKKKKQMVGKSTLPITKKGKRKAGTIRNAFDISSINGKNGNIVGIAKIIAGFCRC